MSRATENPLKLAAAHFARLEMGTATQDECDTFAQWCDSAPAHRLAWETICEGWNSASSAQDDDGLKELVAACVERHPAIVKARSSHRWTPIALAASLVAAIVLPTAWYMADRQATPSTSATINNPAPANSRYFASAHGVRRSVQLPDGSRVTLDSDSAMRIAFRDDRRSIWLEKGRAHFAVRKDKARPFLVDAGRLHVVAVGTAFDVSRNDGNEEVVTTEGLVRVVTDRTDIQGKHANLLPAGMKLYQDAKGVAISSADIAADSAWRDGKILFSSECLATVAARINRYGARQLVIGKDARSIAISGVFELDNALALAQALDDQGLVRIASDKTVITLTRGPNGHSGSCNRS